MKKLKALILLVAFCVQLVPSAVFSQSRHSDQIFEQQPSGLSFRTTSERSDNLDTASPRIGGPQMWGGRGQLEGAGAILAYQVHVVGEVHIPGTYRIPVSDRISEVLELAGGISPNGSSRLIELRRNGKIQQIDLMNFRLFGDLSQNPYLLDNDTIYVPLVRGKIQVVGAVKRPMEYELRSEKSLFDAIQLAGGMTAGVSREQSVRIIRFTGGEKTVMKSATDRDALESFQILQGDVIYVPHVITKKNTFDFNLPKLPGDNIFYPSFEDRVFILGGVDRPGTYAFNPYYSVPQYLSVAGGTTKLSTNKRWIISPEGEKRRISKKEYDRAIVNPGDTILVGERRIPPEGWINLLLAVAGFGLSTTATVLTLKK